MKCAKNVPRAKFTHLDEKLQFFFDFSIFRKVFKTEGKHHIFTLGQVKYQNSLIWMKKEPKKISKFTHLKYQ